MHKPLEEKDILAIIEKVKQGQTQAFNALVLVYEKQVFSLALRMLRHKEDAEEVAQDSFVKAYQRIKSFKGRSKFSTWLYRIAYNNCLNKLTANKRSYLYTDLKDEYLGGTGHDQSMELTRNAERKKHLDLALAKLGQHEVTLITLYYQNECSLPEMEEITGVRKETLKVQLHRARKQLEKRLTEMLNSEVKNII